jgi:hypothetical protein
VTTWIDRLIDDLQNGSPNYAWHIYDHWKSLQGGEDATYFFYDLQSFADNGILTVVQRAQIFWCLWTSERVWDTNAELARAWMIQFHSIQSDVRTRDEAEFVMNVMRACPCLEELDQSDNDWVDYQLPAERNNPRTTIDPN